MSCSPSRRGAASSVNKTPKRAETGQISVHKGLMCLLTSLQRVVGLFRSMACLLTKRWRPGRSIFTRNVPHRSAFSGAESEYESMQGYAMEPQRGAGSRKCRGMFNSGGSPAAQGAHLECLSYACLLHKLSGGNMARSSLRMSSSARNERSTCCTRTPSSPFSSCRPHT